MAVGRNLDKGIKGNLLEVPVRDGSVEVLTADLPPAHRAFAKPPNARQSIRKDTLALSAEVDRLVRAELRKVTRNLERSLKNAASKRRDDGRLPPTVRDTIELAARKKLREALSFAKSQMRSAIGDMVGRDLAAQAELYRSQGIEPPSKKALAGIRRSVVDEVFSRPFPGTELTINDRFKAQLSLGYDRLRAIVRTSPGRLPASLKKLKRGFHMGKPGATRVEGGGLSKSVARMQKAEQARALREASLRLADQMGVEVAYWRLNPRHKFYGGKEICEKLAVGTGSDVAATLQRAGYDPSTVDLAGMYTVARYPEIPHPNCMCFAEGYTL